VTLHQQHFHAGIRVAQKHERRGWKWGHRFDGHAPSVTRSASDLKEEPIDMAAEANLKSKNITLPTPNAPLANYVTSVRVGNLLFLAGHGPSRESKAPTRGKVGKDLTVEQGYQAARDVGIALLSTTRAALGSLDKVKRVVKVLGMVNCAEDFGDQPKVMNGFSDLMVEIFGETVGRHARSAVGMGSLPSQIPVEIEMILEVE